MLQVKQGECLFELWSDTDGRLIGVVLDERTERLLGEARSPPVIVPAGSEAVILLEACFICEGSLRLTINGSPVEQDGSPLAGLNPLPPRERTSDEAEQVAARTMRRQRQRSYEKAGLSEGEIIQRWSDLRRECRLLAQATDNLNRGDFDHVVTVSSHLRKLIGRSKGNHILQDCAGFSDASLLIWTSPPQAPGAWSPAELNPSLWMDFNPVAASPDRVLTHKMDLDTWLNLPAGGIEALGSLTQLEMLHAIADKIGAHADLRGRELVTALGEYHLEDRSALACYLITLSQTTLSVAERLLQVIEKPVISGSGS